MTAHKDIYAKIGLFNVAEVAEEAIGENIVWLTDMLDPLIRRGDRETLKRLKQLNDAHVLLAKAIKMYGD